MRGERGAQPSHPFHDGREVHAHVAGGYAEGAAAALCRGGTCRAQETLGRHTADVETVTTQEIALDDGDRRAKRRRADRGYETGRTRAEDDEVVPAGGLRIRPSGGMHLREERAVMLIVGTHEGRNAPESRQRSRATRSGAGRAPVTVLARRDTRPCQAIEGVDVPDRAGAG